MTPPIRAFALGWEVEQALTSLPGISTARVKSRTCGPWECSWLLTMESATIASSGNFLGDMSLLTPMSDGLSGSGVGLYSTKGLSGASALQGSFRLGVKGSSIATASIPVGTSAYMLENSLRSSLSEYPVPLSVKVTRNLFTEGDRNQRNVTRYTLTLQPSSDLTGHMVYETANGHNVSLLTQRALPALLLETQDLSGAISSSVTELSVHSQAAPSYRRHLVSVAYPTVTPVQETQTLLCSSWSHPDTSEDDRVEFTFRGLSTPGIWLHSHLERSTLPLCTSR